MNSLPINNEANMWFGYNFTVTYVYAYLWGSTDKYYGDCERITKLTWYSCVSKQTIEIIWESESQLLKKKKFKVSYSYESLHTADTKYFKGCMQVRKLTCWPGTGVTKSEILWTNKKPWPKEDCNE